MSAIHRLKSQIKYQRSGGMQSHNSHYGGSNVQQDVVVLPEKPKKKRKIMEVQKESKQTMKTLPKQGGSDMIMGGGGEEEGMEMDDGDDEENEKGEEKKDPKKVPWGPPEILDHLKEPQLIDNINYVIHDLKKTEEEDGSSQKDKKGHPVEIVWDHSASKEGKKSDNNFFIWFETVAANEAKKVMAKENMIFE